MRAKITRDHVTGSMFVKRGCPDCPKLSGTAKAVAEMAVKDFSERMMSFLTQEAYDGHMPQEIVITIRPK